MLKMGRVILLEKTYDINNTLDPTAFYRVNKQFIIAKDSIKEIVVWFDNRLLIRLDTDTRKDLCPKNRASEFKKWMV